MTLPSKLEIDRASRRGLGQRATLRDPEMQPYDILVEDLSTTGCRVILNVDLPLGTRVHVGIDGVGMRAAYVARGGRPTYGCAFREPLSESEVRQAAIAETVFAAEFPHLMRQTHEEREVGRAGARPARARRVSLWVDAAVLIAIVPFAVYAWNLMHR